MVEKKAKVKYCPISGGFCLQKICVFWNDVTGDCLLKELIIITKQYLAILRGEKY